jgi:hypothetical protein
MKYAGLNDEEDGEDAIPPFKERTTMRIAADLGLWGTNAETGEDVYHGQLQELLAQTPPLPSVNELTAEEVYAARIKYPELTPALNKILDDLGLPLNPPQPPEPEPAPEPEVPEEENPEDES